MPSRAGRVHPSQALATVLVDELVRGGVREAVLSPGSRNAPLSYALLDADRAGRLRLHVRIDERTAGFLALGLARRSGAPVLVTCTSGTAAVNLHPALVEADLSGVPVVALTADRPAHLRRTGANQTIEQVGLFGGAVRFAADIPAPGAPGTGTGSPVSAGAGDNAVWRSLVCRALDAATGARSRLPGPVHLDVGFAEPLTPDPGSRSMPDALAGRPGGDPWTRTPARGHGWSGADGAHGTTRTLVVLGVGADPAVAAVAARAGWPVVAEPPAWHLAAEPLAAGTLLLGVPALLEAAPPDRVVLSGRPTLGRSVGSLLSRSSVETVVVAPAGDWTDPQHVAATVLDGVGGLAPTAVEPVWAGMWRAADAAAAAARDEACADGVEGPALARLVRDAAAGSGGQDAQPGLLVCASSQSVRDLDAAGPAPLLDVVANRGVAGIDGTVSTAVGAALADQARGWWGGEARPAGHPAFLLVGDLAFLHDLTGLVIGPGEPRPDLTVVVADDDGGAIFATLEYGAPELANSFERVFGTPHGVDVPGLCAGLGIPCTSTSDPAIVRSLLADRSGGLRVVHVGTDRSGRRARDRALRAAVAAAVTSTLP